MNESIHSIHVCTTAESSCLYAPQGGSKNQSNFSCCEPWRCCGGINSKEDGFQPEWRAALIILDSGFCKKFICSRFFMSNCQQFKMLFRITKHLHMTAESHVLYCRCVCVSCFISLPVYLIFFLFYRDGTELNWFTCRGDEFILTATGNVQGN